MLIDVITQLRIIIIRFLNLMHDVVFDEKFTLFIDVIQTHCVFKNCFFKNNRWSKNNVRNEIFKNESNRITLRL